MLLGYQASISILLTPPGQNEISGLLLYLSSMLGSLVAYLGYHKKLNQWLYSYLFLGFLAANCSLLVLFFLNGLLSNNMSWNLSDFLFLFVMPFAALLMTYVFGFVFFAIIPALGASMVLYIYDKYLKKTHNQQAQ